MMVLRKLSLVLVLLALAACSSQGPEQASVASGADSLSKVRYLHSSSTIKTPSDIHQRLMLQYDDWSGTPYRYGGVGRKGIDCSAFVSLTYLERFNIELPRTTLGQVKQGDLIKKSQLEIGDLVFFRISSQQRHVGMYVGENQFLHVSTKKGVIISDLDNPYWRGRYWQARRLPLRYL
ncbi:hypothetical protein DBZ36_15855 [Alginatibacterium sediminis]|uniref:NlpC/P60 domain-containing protein n=1 Tax=Alginatibacterium sediminis TaxID=2164068 RepID=A0A420E8U0_9ALTE|nr:NlpC/P60 family protein [Alginatibacterium sediminis]RKF15845.1 hypothetical protein DBZ36_15855 [Alginatibacterium sediminis]